MLNAFRNQSTLEKFEPDEKDSQLDTTFDSGTVWYEVSKRKPTDPWWPACALQALDLDDAQHDVVDQTVL